MAGNSSDAVSFRNLGKPSRTNTATYSCGHSAMGNTSRYACGTCCGISVLTLIIVLSLSFHQLDQLDYGIDFDKVTSTRFLDLSLPLPYLRLMLTRPASVPLASAD